MVFRCYRCGNNWLPNVWCVDGGGAVPGEAALDTSKATGTTQPLIVTIGRYSCDQSIKPIMNMYIVLDSSCWCLSMHTHRVQEIGVMKAC